MLILSLFAEKRENKIPLFFSALLLSLFCGLRGVGTGVDTTHYYTFMSYIRLSGISYGSDIGFSAISYVLMSFFDNPHYPLLIYAMITNFLIVYRLWNFRTEASFPLMMLIYVVVYYPYTFNIVRQFLAISIIFWATKFIEQKKYARYIIANAIASSIHTSSLMCFCLLFLPFNKEKNDKLYKVVGLGFALLLIIAGLDLYNANIHKYEGHFVVSHAKSQMMSVFKIIWLSIIVLLGRVFGNNQFSISKYGTCIPMQIHVPMIYAAGLGLSTLSMLFPFMNRIGFYFIMYEMPFWGQAVRAKVDAVTYKMAIFVIVGYVLVSKILSGENADNLFYYNSFLSQI
ncbi:EpsG family protein [Fibrobacter succinogenes]|uniref:EpsG family protein n=1 Tax=Fibrobacter succinogenes TaxID=833 RepID=UPI00215AFF98|nr:EpsG family protein [Fibrobacter succinogenes]